VAGSNLFTQAQIFGIKNGKMGTLKNDVNPLLLGSYQQMAIS
jgi:hypothetical protein